MSDDSRYQRQQQLSVIGAAGQQRLKQAKVLIVGMGGLGCQVGAQLAGAGVGELTIADADEIELHNLHRQILFREGDIGQNKAVIAKRELAAINSGLKVIAYDRWFGPELALATIPYVDLVIDTADNLATSYLLNDFCWQHRVPLLTASVNRTFGYLGVFCGSNTQPAPSLRAVFPRLPAIQLSCETVGVTGPGVGVIASYQAQEALKVLLNDKQQLLGQLMYLDLWQYRQHIVDFSKAKEPTDKQIALLGTNDLATSDLIIDVRSAEEAASQPQQFRVDQHIPLAEISAADIPPVEDRRIVLTCRSGQRALAGAQQLIDNGHRNVATLLPD